MGPFADLAASVLVVMRQSDARMNRKDIIRDDDDVILEITPISNASLRSEGPATIVVIEKKREREEEDMVDYTWNPK